MTLGVAELERLVGVRAEISDSRRYVPICLGLSGASTRKLLDTLDETAAWPIDGYLIASPYYTRPSQRGLCNISASLPTTPPGRSCSTTFPTGPRSISPTRRCCELARHPNIVGIKDCCADRAQSIDLLREAPAGFRVLTGEDAQYHEALADGADGAILLSAHVETEAFAAVQTLLRRATSDGALACWESVSELTRLLFAEPSPAPAKYWLARTGLIDSAEVRLPMVEVGAELAARLDAEIERRRTASVRAAE